MIAVAIIGLIVGCVAGIMVGFAIGLGVTRSSTPRADISTALRRHRS